jgi:FHS family L-fucose permease-like MFS transporter
MTNDLMQSDTLAVPAEGAGKRLALCWRASLRAVILIAMSVFTTGALSGYALLAVGVVNPVMFSTIFTLASAGLGKRTAEGSGIVCMAIVGSAIIPPPTGFVANVSSQRIAPAIPVACYVIIALYARFCATPEPCAKAG